jgi:hypothetical protein
MQQRGHRAGPVEARRQAKLAQIMEAVVGRRTRVPLLYEKRDMK